MMEAQRVTPGRSTPHWTIGLISALALFSLVAFEWQHQSAQKLAQENQQVTAALQQTQAQLDLLKAKIDALTPAPAPTPIAQAKPAAAIPRHHAAVQHASVHAAKHRHVADDPRWKQLQSRLDEQGNKLDAQGNKLDEYGKQIDSTRQDLSSTRTELSGSIARTHGELVALERKGERSYFEFDVSKSKQFRATGPVGIRLKKANQKHSYADLELMVDDADLSKKHVNLFEPVVFYATDEGRPVELVINGISKDRIHGYVATPKYKKDELSAMATASGTVTDGSESQVPARQKLSLPKN
jgi:hypothetical protein